MLNLFYRGLLISLITLATALSACAQSDKKKEETPKATRKDNPPTGEARVFFLSPIDGATVKSPFEVQFGVQNLIVESAGVVNPRSGHHHILINRGPIPAGEVIPTDEKHLHFGKGQSKVTVTLPPGQYTLTMQFADGAHRSYGPNLSATIRVLVK